MRLPWAKKQAAPPPTTPFVDNGELVDIDRDPTASEEAETFKNEEERSKRLRNDSDQQDMQERMRYASYAYSITVSWVTFLIVVVIGQMALKPTGLVLSEAEFITVVTTTTASIFGFWLLVGQYLFHRPKA